MLPSSCRVPLGRVRKLRRYALWALRLCRARRLLEHAHLRSHPYYVVCVVLGMVCLPVVVQVRKELLGLLDRVYP